MSEMKRVHLKLPTCQKLQTRRNSRKYSGKIINLHIYSAEDLPVKGDAIILNYPLVNCDKYRTRSLYENVRSTKWILLLW